MNDKGLKIVESKLVEYSKKEHNIKQAKFRCGVILEVESLVNLKQRFEDGSIREMGHHLYRDSGRPIYGVVTPKRQDYYIKTDGVSELLVVENNKEVWVNCFEYLENFCKKQEQEYQVKNTNDNLSKQSNTNRTKKLR